MAVIKIDDFSGERPIVHATSLLPHNASYADKCRFNPGTVSPLYATTDVQDQVKVGTIKSIFKYSATHWFEWTDDVNAVRSLVPNDLYGRVMYTGDGLPKVTDSTIATSGASGYPGASYSLGVPAPSTAAAIASIDGTYDEATELLDTRYYFVTYVNSYGEEGAPSPASAQAEVGPQQTVTLTLPGAPTGAFAVTTKRIYRTSTGTSNTIPQYVGEVAVATGSFVDDVAAADLGEELGTVDYDLPAENMAGLVSHPGGFLAGFFGNALAFSEPAAPHAWPVKYELSTEEPIVGLGTFGNSIVVATEGRPYLATGTHPEAVSMAEIEVDQSCVAKRGIVSYGYGVVYPSPDGLVLVGVKGAQLITKDIFSQDQWEEYNPSSMHAYKWEDKYLLFYDTGVTQGGMYIDPLFPERGIVHISEYATAGYNDLSSDTLYLSIGGTFVEWDSRSAGNLTYTWKSKTFIAPALVNPGAAKVLADSYPLTFKLYAGGALKHTQSVQNAAPFRLPSGYLAHEYAVELVGSKVVYEVNLGETMDDLRRV